MLTFNPKGLLIPDTNIVSSVAELKKHFVQNIPPYSLPITKINLPTNIFNHQTRHSQASHPKMRPQFVGILSTFVLF